MYEPQALFQRIGILFTLTFIIGYLAVFIFSDYKNLYVPSILHLYHHLFAELVHLYNLPLYWVCWGQETLCYLVAGLFERDHLHPMPPTD